MNSGGKFSLNRWENQRRLPGREAGAHCRSYPRPDPRFIFQTNELVDLEELSDEDLKKLEKQFQRIRQKAEHDGNHPRDAASATRVEESE